MSLAKRPHTKSLVNIESLFGEQTDLSNMALYRDDHYKYVMRIIFEIGKHHKEKISPDLVPENLSYIFKELQKLKVRVAVS